jgi:hypothetical protein
MILEVLLLSGPITWIPVAPTILADDDRLDLEEANDLLFSVRAGEGGEYAMTRR